MHPSPLVQAQNQFTALLSSGITPERAAAAGKLAASLQPDGSWADIDYSDGSRSDWPAALHPARMLQIATLAASDPSRREALLPALHRAFAFWIKNDFQCPNWWHNQIGVPQNLGSCGLLLGPALLPQERSYLVDTLLPRSAISMTGQNRLWLAGNTFFLAVLSENQALADTVALAIWDSVIISPGEGIQPDFTFHQHGAQQQFGNYGLSFAHDIQRWILIFHQTPWQIPPEKLDIHRHYLLDGQNWVVWRGAMDISSCGRQLRARAPELKAAVLLHVMRQAQESDPAHAADYQAFIRRNHPGAANDLIGHRHFWRSDYTVHRSKEFFATLKMSSHRVVGTECVNSENLSGYHLADGVLFLYRTGGEYSAIFPVWDWRSLPGTTTTQKDVPGFKRSSVPTDFVGGVSEGRYGVSALDYQRDGLSARKAWFFSPDSLYCLGSAINAPESHATTTIEQSLLQGPVTSDQGPAPLTSGSFSDLSWIEHAGFRYTLLSTEPVLLSTEPVTGNWNRVFISPSAPRNDVTLPVFKLQIDHGPSPDHASYAWAASLAGHPPLGKVLANTPALQAVQLSPSLIGLVFWNPGSFTAQDGTLLSVDAPCIVLFHPRDHRLTLADPTQKLPSLRVSLGSRTQLVPLPAAEFAGSSVTLSLLP